MVDAFEGSGLVVGWLEDTRPSSRYDHGSAFRGKLALITPTNVQKFDFYPNKCPSVRMTTSWDMVVEPSLGYAIYSLLKSINV